MTLLPLASEHLELVLQWRNAPSIRENMYTSHMISMDEHRTWFEKTKDSNTAKWFVYHEKNGDPAGVVGFTDINERNHNAFWGFYTAENSPPGIGSRMGYEALEHAFQQYKFHKLNGEILAHNAKSIRYHEKLGFTREGLFRDHHFDGSNYVDIVRMGILKHEWSKKRLSVLDALARFS